MPHVSLVLPCYEEGPTLRASLDRIVDTMRRTGWSFELILIDDASRDATPQVVSAFADEIDAPVRTIFHERNRGRGATVCEGLSVADGAVMGFLDVDLEVDCVHVPRFVRAVQAGADVVTARRVYDVGVRDLHRYLASRVYSRLVRRRLDVPLADTEAGFKFFAPDAAQALVAETRDPGWFWDTEVLAVALRKGLEVVELPAPYVRRRDKRSTVRLLPDTIEYLRAMRRFRER